MLLDWPAGLGFPARFVAVGSLSWLVSEVEPAEEFSPITEIARRIGLDARG